MKNLILILLTPFLMWQYTADYPDQIVITVNNEQIPLSQPCYDLESLSSGEHTIEIGPVVFWYWKSERSNKKFIFVTHDLDFNTADAKYFTTDNLPLREKIKK